ncbi:hypothetical protein CAPTEDRAFT_187530, partial [Capitella teleta]
MASSCLRLGFMEHVRLCPSTLVEIKENRNERPAPIKVYRDLTSGHTAVLQGVLNPYNKEQFRKCQKQVLAAGKLGPDTLDNTHELSLHLGNNIWLLITQSRLVWYFRTRRLCPKVLGTVGSRNAEKVSEVPRNLLHEKIPKLYSANMTIVDREQGIVNTIRDVFPDTNKLYCWNHIRADLERWLRKEGTCGEDVPFYLNDLYSLLHRDESTTFHLKCSELTGKSLPQCNKD